MAAPVNAVAADLINDLPFRGVRLSKDRGAVISLCTSDAADLPILINSLGVGTGLTNSAPH